MSDPIVIHIYIYLIYICNTMDEIREFINTFFQTTTKSVEYGLRCSFITEVGEEGYCIFKKGKQGWNNKPVMNSPYIMTESNMSGVFQIISSRFDINENHYEGIKDEINKMVDRSIKDFLDPHL